eukprot:gnl/MRDRNA2_/MRDRNA2_96735_c0_seq1.p1 gnl/MRDRNA2_/MRDRNA2_96735_c0~~gnl/MRDRNA2_/MRDRNA2_96735_c0_seq1.p1  ORF type:complete len:416 (+),score=64.41 gnl/MRDRNA2_/MRDRNA2_96735_c0_seq1:83-1249(+)
MILYFVFALLAAGATALRISPLQDDGSNSAFTRLLGSPDLEEDGEAQFLINEVRRVNPTINEEEFNEMLTDGWLSNMTERVRLQWHVSAEEDKALGKDVSSLSDFSKAIPKFPRSWVDRITQLNDEKKYRYTFSGSFCHLNQFRRWLPEFVKEHFGDEDYFRATDSNTLHRKNGKPRKEKVKEKYPNPFEPSDTYEPLGSFDRTVVSLTTTVDEYQQHKKSLSKVEIAIENLPTIINDIALQKLSLPTEVGDANRKSVQSPKQAKKKKDEEEDEADEPGPLPPPFSPASRKGRKSTSPTMNSLELYKEAAERRVSELHQLASRGEHFQQVKLHTEVAEKRRSELHQLKPDGNRPHRHQVLAPERMKITGVVTGVFEANDNHADAERRG